MRDGGGESHVCLTRMAIFPPDPSASVSPFAPPQDVFLCSSRLPSPQLQAQPRERVSLLHSSARSPRDQSHWSIPGHVTCMNTYLMLLLAGPESCDQLERQKMAVAGRHFGGWSLQPCCCPYQGQGLQSPPWSQEGEAPTCPMSCVP